MPKNQSCVINLGQNQTIHSPEVVQKQQPPLSLIFPTFPVFISLEDIFIKNNHFQNSGQIWAKYVKLHAVCRTKSTLTTYPVLLP